MQYISLSGCGMTSDVIGEEVNVMEFITTAFNTNIVNILKLKVFHMEPAAFLFCVSFLNYTL